MKWMVWAFALASVLVASGAAVVHAQPPMNTPAPAPSQQLSPQSPGGGSGEQIPIREAPTGGVQWERFGGDPSDAPADLDSFIVDAIGWLRTLTLICAVGGVLIIAATLTVGIRGRSEQAKTALKKFPIVLAATVMSGSAYTVISMFL